MEIVWLPKTLENLQRILARIAEEQLAPFEKVGHGIKQAVVMLGKYPQRGK